MGPRQCSSSRVVVLRSNLGLRLGVSSSSSSSRRSTRLRLGRAVLLRRGCCRRLERIRLGSHFLLFRGSSRVLHRGSLGNPRVLLHGSRSIRLGSSPSMGRGSSRVVFLLPGRGRTMKVWSRPLLLLSGGTRRSMGQPPLGSIPVPLLLGSRRSMLLPGSSRSLFQSIPLLGSRLPGSGAPLPGAGSFLQGRLF